MGRFGRKGRKSSASSQGDSGDESTSNMGVGSVRTPIAGMAGGNVNNSNTSGGMVDVPVTPHAGSSVSAGMDGRQSTASSVNTQKTQEIQGKIKEVSSVMEQNIQGAMQRGEDLNDLQTKTEALQAGAAQFSKNATVVKKNLWWKNMKMTICIVVLVIAVIGAIVGIYFLTSGSDKKATA